MATQRPRRQRAACGIRLWRGRWVATVAFTIDRKGQVLASRIVQGTGVRALDEEALAVLQRVALPPIPDELPGETFEFELPYSFSVN